MKFPHRSSPSHETPFAFFTSFYSIKRQTERLVSVFYVYLFVQTELKLVMNFYSVSAVFILSIQVLELLVHNMTSISV